VESTAPEPDAFTLRRDQIKVIASGLYTLASSDAVDDREIQIIHEFLDDAGASDLKAQLPDLYFDPAGAYDALESSWLRSLFLRAALLLVRADGSVTEQERDTLDWMTMAFGVQGGYEGLVQAVEGQTLAE
jgi:hypothetical protein